MKLWLVLLNLLSVCGANPLDYFYQTLHIAAGVCEQTSKPALISWFHKSRAILLDPKSTNSWLLMIASKEKGSHIQALDCEEAKILGLFEGTIPGERQNTKILAVSLALTMLQNPPSEAWAHRLVLSNYTKIWVSLMLLEQRFVANSPEFQSM
ncbi:MAG: hypothetical protein H3C47_06525 [Candidatus Cloacimonetes bacterium]|nr:hypothetical protein [Candidatus Cloacimonadota bacterium]